jgi:hypothetical protein
MKREVDTPDVYPGFRSRDFKEKNLGLEKE